MTVAFPPPPYEVGRLEITGYKGKEVANTFFRQRVEARHLGVVLPGMGYTCDMPLLYYSTQALLDMGADVLNVNYDYRHEDFDGTSNDEQRRWVSTDVGAAWQSALQQRRYQRITLVGKSLGTLAMGGLLSSKGVPEGTGAVWLTPLLKIELLLEQVRMWAGRSLFVIGTADPHYDRALLSELEVAMHGASLVIEGADHSMEIERDLQGSVSALEQYVVVLQSFLDPERKLEGATSNG